MLEGVYVRNSWRGGDGFGWVTPPKDESVGLDVTPAGSGLGARRERVICCLGAKCGCRLGCFAVMGGGGGD